LRVLNCLNYLNRRRAVFYPPVVVKPPFPLVAALPRWALCG
jgi:hypothetical protein